MLKKFFFAVLVFAAVLFLFIKFGVPSQVSVTQDIENELYQPVEEVRRDIKTSAPIRAEQDTPEALLTVGGTLFETNLQRESNGFPVFSANPKLTLAAEMKARDMFEKQYFAHVSPTGVGSGELAGLVEYEYIIIGENLALGNYENDKALVQAWMDSPGHRANILSNKFTEIGVAVIKGTYEGKTTWLAVQEFGFPESACPAIDDDLKDSIDENRIQLDALTSQLNAKKQEVDSYFPKRGVGYNQKVSEYNALVEEYNEFVSKTKGMITSYNSQVEAFNKCRSD